MLRLPRSLAARVEELMALPDATQEMAVDIQFVEQPGYEPGRAARVRIGVDYFPAILMDLPTVVEAHKSTDGINYYKTGHVGQVLVVSEMMMSSPPPSSYSLPDGLTPPTRGIRAHWDRYCPLDATLASVHEVENVEARLKQIADGQTTPAAGFESIADGAMSGDEALLEEDGNEVAGAAGRAVADADGDTAQLNRPAGRATAGSASDEPRRAEQGQGAPVAFSDLFGDASDNSDAEEASDQESQTQAPLLP